MSARLPLRIEDIRLLFARSGGECAFPNCRNTIFDGDKYVGKVCHIEAANEGGKRYNKALSPEERRKSSNLILLCGYHHDIVDSDEDKYTVAWLKSLKGEHESRELRGFQWNESLEQDFQRKYHLQIENDLKLIRDILEHLAEFKTLEVAFGERIGDTYLPALQMVKDNLFYFSKEENTIIEQLRQRISAATARCLLLCGHPSSGKTSLALVVSEELKKDGFEIFYLNLSHDFQRASVQTDLVILKNHNAVLVIDDIHAGLAFAKELYQAADEYPNLMFLFLSRIIDKEFQKDSEGFSIYDQLAGNSFFIKTDSYEAYQAKVKGIVELRQRFHQQRGRILRIGNPNKVAKNSQMNLFKLHLMMKIWETGGDSLLEEINDQSLKDDLQRRYLEPLDAIDKKRLSQFASLGSFDVEFVVLGDEPSTKTLRERGLMLGDARSGFFFVHSKFAELMLDAVLSTMETDFEYRWNKDRDRFVADMISEYIQSFDTSEYFPRYPKNLPKILENIGFNRGRFIFASLVSNPGIKGQIIDYYRTGRPTPAILRSFLQQLNILSRSELSNYFDAIVLANTDFNNIIQSGPEAFEALSYVLTVQRQTGKQSSKRTLGSLLSSDALKKVLLNSRLSSISLYLHIAGEKKQAQDALKLLSVSEWIDVFKRQGIVTIGNSLTEMRRMDAELAHSILSGLDTNILVTKTLGRRFDNQTKFLSELKELDLTKARQILDSLDKNSMVIELHRTDPRQIGIGLSRLLGIDPGKAKEIYERLNESHLADQLKRVEPNDIGRVLDELKRVSSEKTLRVFRLMGTPTDFAIMLSQCRALDEIYTLVHTLDGFEHDRCAEMVRQLDKGRICKMIERSKMVQISFFVFVLSAVDQNSAKYFVSKFDDKFFKEKLLHRDTSLTQMGKSLKELNSINHARFKELVEKIPNIEFIKKAMQYDITFRQTAGTFSEFRQVNKDKTTSVYNNLRKQRVFVRKAIESDLPDFLVSIKIFHKIDASGTDQLLKEYLQGYDKRFRSSKFPFSSFCQALSGFSKDVDKQFSARVLNKFEPKLFDYLKLCNFNQLAAGLSDLHTAFPELARTLLRRIPADELLNKIQAVDGNGRSVGLGEIRKIDQRVHQALTQRMSAM
jgi:hypothetical protein